MRATLRQCLVGGAIAWLVAAEPVQSQLLPVTEAGSNGLSVPGWRSPGDFEPNNTPDTALFTGLYGDGSVTVYGGTIGNGDYPEIDRVLAGQE